MTVVLKTPNGLVSTAKMSARDLLGIGTAFVVVVGFLYTLKANVSAMQKDLEPIVETQDEHERMQANNAARLALIEATRYTHESARADRLVLSDRVRSLETGMARQTVLLENISEQLRKDTP